MNTPDQMYQYRGIAGKPAALLCIVRRVGGGFRPSYELLQANDEKDAMKAANERRTELAADAEVERIIVGLVMQELRRQPAEENGQVVVPFNRERNGRH